MAEGDTRHCPDAAQSGGRRRSAKAITTTLKAVREMRPAPNEFIVCTDQGSPPATETRIAHSPCLIFSQTPMLFSYFLQIQPLSRTPFSAKPKLKSPRYI